jgi:hypothetical protein
VVSGAPLAQAHTQRSIQAGWLGCVGKRSHQCPHTDIDRLIANTTQPSASPSLTCCDGTFRNFINHFRNAECSTKNTMRAVGTTMPGGWSGSLGGWSQTGTGGYAQCCSSCSSTPGCAGWTYDRNNCTLMASITGWESCPNGGAVESIDTCVGGTRGTFPIWTPLPANFRNNGYLTMGVGKYYHPGGHSAGGAPGDIAHPAGAGTPPLADRDMSWTPAGPNGTLQFPDQTVLQAKWGLFHGGQFGPFGNFEYLNPDEEPCRQEADDPSGSRSSDYCNPKWPLDGTPPMPPKEGQQALCDFVTYNVAIEMLQYAAENRAKTGQPFFQVTGIKRPHLNWRAPAGYVGACAKRTFCAPFFLSHGKRSFLICQDRLGTKIKKIA